MLIPALHGQVFQARVERCSRSKSKLTLEAALESSRDVLSMTCNLISQVLKAFREHNLHPADGSQVNNCDELCNQGAGIHSSHLCCFRTETVCKWTLR